MSDRHAVKAIEKLAGQLGRATLQLESMNQHTQQLQERNSQLEENLNEHQRQLQQLRLDLQSAQTAPDPAIVDD